MDKDLVSTVVAGVIGLVGVGVGGWLTARALTAERRSAWLRKQLDEFYSPLLGMREIIRAKSESRQKTAGASLSAWSRLFEGEKRPVELTKLQKEHGPAFEKGIEYDNRVLREEILPTYRRMIEHFSTHIGLAEPETRSHFDELVHFMDIWDRSEAGALPPEVLQELGQSEKKLYPLYENLAANVTRIQDELRAESKKARVATLIIRRET